MTRTSVAIALLLAACGLTACAGGTTTPGAQGTTRAITRPPVAGASTTGPTPARRPVPPTVTPSTGSGIAGLTTIDGGCPVMRADPPCRDRVVAARLSIVDTSDGIAVAAVGSGADGQFVVAVKPGHYLIRLISIAGGPPHPQMPATVTVTAGHYTAVTLRFDTGVR